MDDPFREVFNRDDDFKEDGTQFIVAIYLKGGPLVPPWSKTALFPDSNSTGPIEGVHLEIASSNLTIFSGEMPLLVRNINLTIQ